MARRTDLALEEKELFHEQAGEITEISGVIARNSQCHGMEVTTVEVLDEMGSKTLGKPVGCYVTLDLQPFVKKQPDSFPDGAKAIGVLLGEMMDLDEQDTVLVVGLGNRAVTPDAIGPTVLDHLLVTRHLVEQLPQYFGGYRTTTALAPGVLGLTGMESSEVVAGVVAQVKPDAIVVVDALASRNLARVCTTIQMADSGITPGSGVHNARLAFSKEQLGVPVYGLGVPTVVEGETLLEDYSSGEKQAQGQGICRSHPMIVTPRDIDQKIKELSKLIAYGINLAIHPNVTLEDLAYFVE